MNLVTTWFGTFLLDGESRVLEKCLFPAEPSEIARRLKSMEAGEVLPEEEAMASGKDVLVGERRLQSLGILASIQDPGLRPEDFGTDPAILVKAMLLKGRDKLRASATPDEHMVQAIRAVDDLSRIINLMSERLHEWHALNFPELTAMVPEATYLNLIAEHGSREAMVEAGKLSAGDSLGTGMSESDTEAVKSLASSILAMARQKEAVESYIEGRMREIAPNLTHLAGPLIAARLISLTGGMDRLSRMPSSTVQLLGAEKALFKHLKENARPPKHGVIFQHPLIHRAPPWQRGKIARAFAAKLSLAARADRHGGRFMGPELEADLNRRIEDIRKKYPRPKPKSRPGAKQKRKR